MLKIYLARHGQDEDNLIGILNGHRDTPLTVLGLQQAKELADNIYKTSIKFDKIYSSPLQRAFKTAEVLAKITNCEAVEVLDNLIERDFGVMTGESVHDIEKECAPNIIKGERITYFLSPQGAETFPDLINRAKNILDFVRKKHQDGSVLLVTSGDIGKMIYAAYYNLDWQQVLTLFHFGNSDLLLLSKDSPPENSHVFKFTQYNN